jgi:hypothetical protein
MALVLITKWAVQATATTTIEFQTQEAAEAYAISIGLYASSIITVTEQVDDGT